MATSAYTRDVLRVVVAQICQTIGWQSIQTTPLEVLTDILSRYMHSLGTSAHRYGEQFGHTEPSILDIDLAFRDLGVSVPELKEYVRDVDPVPCAIKVPKYPVERESHLNLLKPGSQEVVTRPVHIYDHLPPMHQHLAGEAPLSVTVNVTGSECSTSPLPSPKTSLVKRLGDSPSRDNSSPKQLRTILEEEGPALRELNSVIMTKSGFLSSAREGRLPEAIQVSNWKSYHTDPSETNGSKLSRNSVTEGIRKLAKKKKSKTKDRPKTDSPSAEQAKKLASMKNMCKMKAVKKAIKMHSPTKEVKKINKHKNAPGMSPWISSLPKIPKLKHKNESSKDGNKHTASNFDKITEDNVTDQKIVSKPDRQKLNIFKKISKVKDDKINTSHEVGIGSEPAEMNRQRVLISETIENVIHNKEQLDDVEVVEVDSPDPGVSSYNGDDLSPLQILTPQRSSDHFPQKQSDERQKTKKKIKSNLFNSSPKRFKFESTESAYSMFENTEVESFPDDLFPEPPKKVENTSDRFRMFPFVPAPGLVPSFDGLKLQIENQASSFHETQIKSLPPQPVSTAPPTPVQLAIPPVNVNTALATPSPVLDVTTVISPLQDTPVSSRQKKDEGSKKEEKTKVKKKKVKKDKVKEKEEVKKPQSCSGSEEIKHKEKKVKKEKRKEKERLEKVKDESSIPKLTLKLGPASPEPSPELTPCKIVIKRIELPKEEKKPEKKAATPVSQFSKSKLSLAEHVLATMPSPTPSTSQSQPTVQAETKAPKKQKQASPKTEKPVAFYFDEQGNQVWICPACGNRDDGSPMIACDGCDAWYHWLCVGIQAPPNANDWFCRICIGKKKDKKKKGKKQKK